jgi:hypothetical protein
LEGLPSSACWTHQGLRRGFEVAYFTIEKGTIRADGTTAGLQDGNSWIVSYSLVLDEQWRTRIARVNSRTAAGQAARLLESDGEGRWKVDGKPAPNLDGCFDVDLESSALTNALPIHRLRLEVGHGADAPAAYVRAVTLRVDRLEQRYLRLPSATIGQQFLYEAPAFNFRCRIEYDNQGLVVIYPGIASRSG